MPKTARTEDTVMNKSRRGLEGYMGNNQVITQTREELQL